MTAPNLHQAQEIGKAGQKLIDAALAELNAHEDLVKTTQAYEDLSITDFLDRVIAALSMSHPELSLMDLGRSGAREAGELTEVAVDEAHGAQYILLSTIASIHLDPQRFSLVIAESAQFCMAVSNLTAIAQEEGALDGLAASTRMLYESLVSFEAILARESDGDALLRRVIKFYGELYEDVAGPLFAWYNLLAGTKQQPYTKLVQKDVSELARSLLRNPATSSFLEKAGVELRNAAQHGSTFSVSGEVVTFRLRSYEEQRTRWEILDEVFSLLESLAAMSWSLSNALTQRGCPVPLSDEDAAYMRVTPFRFAGLWLKDRGTIVLSAEESESAWKFTLDSGSGDVFNLALALAVGVPKSISKVGVRSSMADASLVVPYSAYELLIHWPADSSAPREHLMAVVELRSGCIRNNQSLLTESDLRYAVGCFGLFLLDGDQSVIPHLRRLMKMAGLGHWSVVEGYISECFGLWRVQDARRSGKFTTKLKSWLEQNPAPVIPQSRNVIVAKSLR
ncbi:hypothetical protein [Arthrobacter sp. H5]|uniref:hypothetical protein n=1 Tax=Arthrobacter sp. H5 TaxID=1267973 RepID=UPI001C1E60C1|nr:hypothetical protein [Arthrobacter sp. H5]